MGLGSSGGVGGVKSREGDTGHIPRDDANPTSRNVDHKEKNVVTLPKIPASRNVPIEESKGVRDRGSGSGRVRPLE